MAHCWVLETAALLDDAHISVEVAVGLLGWPRAARCSNERTSPVRRPGRAHVPRQWPRGPCRGPSRGKAGDGTGPSSHPAAAKRKFSRVPELLHHFHPVRDGHLAVLELPVTPKPAGQLHSARGYRVEREQLFRYGHDGPCRPVSAHLRAPSFGSCIKPFREIFVWYRIRATGQTCPTIRPSSSRSAQVTDRVFDLRCAAGPRSAHSRLWRSRGARDAKALAARWYPMTRRSMMPSVVGSGAVSTG